MDLYLKNKVAIVTGGASGIGEKTAEYFVQEGVKVLVADVNRERIEKTVNFLEGMAGDVTGVYGDVTNEKMVAQMVEKAVSHFGTVDFLVNSAGVGGGMSPLENAPQAEWQRILDINLIGTINCCKAVMPILRQKNSGRIMNIASEAGVSGEKGLEVYAASKGGVISLTKSLAKSLGRHNVTVNAVAPAFVHSPMTAFLTPELEKKWLQMYAIKRLGEVGDVASMIVFLCSDRCSWITGQTISINGGFSMK
ncbi:MAG: SDR family oxidoreductase [Deltaproteobacteria bacterium]|nr:SDR family oxidoreductase [Deltaproteobacteria bacterium]